MEEGYVTCYRCFVHRVLMQRIGYLAATQCFHDGLDVVMLTTNMIKKVKK